MPRQVTISRQLPQPQTHKLQLGEEVPCSHQDIQLQIAGQPDNAQLIYPVCHVEWQPGRDQLCNWHSAAYNVVDGVWSAAVAQLNDPKELHNWVGHDHEIL